MVVATRVRAYREAVNKYVLAWVNNPKITKTEAAIQAGCSVKRSKQTGCDLWRNPEVQLEIKRQLANKLNGRVIEGDVVSRELTPERVLQTLDDVAEMCRSAGAGAWQVGTLVKIAELQAEFLQMFKANPVNPSSEHIPTLVTIQFVSAKGGRPADSIAELEAQEHEESVLPEEVEQDSHNDNEPVQAAVSTPLELPPPSPKPSAECIYHGQYLLPAHGAPEICPDCQRETAAYERRIQTLQPARWN